MKRMNIKKQFRIASLLGFAASMLIGGVTASFAQDATPRLGHALPTAADVCGQGSSGTATPAPAIPDQEMPGMDEFDLLFIDLMISHHQGAVEMAIVGQERAEHPEIRQLAGEIIAGQQPEIDEMTVWRSTWYQDAPKMSEADAMNAFDRMTSSMPGMGGMPGSSEMMMGDMPNLEALCSATAEQFDLLFIDGMIAHHQSAIMMAQSALDHATHEEIKTLATAIIAAQQEEIDTMLTWRSLWYPNATPVQG
jgi:uncharacterized protein (DUF305 family)